MTGYLLDTNVISELTKGAPHPNVVDFLEHEAEVWLSSIVVHEIEFGLQLLPAGRRRDSLNELHSNLMSHYADRILSLERSEAEWAARLRARARRAGHMVDLGDALIAGTAIANDLAVATRNVSDFDVLGIKVFDPWASTATL